MTRVLLLASVSLLLTACEAFTPPDAPSFPPDPALSAPNRIVLNASTRFDRHVDVSATVLNANGHGVPNVAVSFAIGDGTISPSSAMTGGDGAAHATADNHAATAITAAIAGGITASVQLLPASP